MANEAQEGVYEFGRYLFKIFTHFQLGYRTEKQLRDFSMLA